MFWHAAHHHATTAQPKFQINKNWPPITFIPNHSEYPNETEICWYLYYRDVFKEFRNRKKSQLIIQWHPKCSLIILQSPRFHLIDLLKANIWSAYTNVCIDYSYPSKLITIYWKLHALRIIKKKSDEDLFNQKNRQQ